MARHCTPHAFCLQVALPPLAGCEHSVVQSPQCCGSLLTSTQVDPHCVGAEAGHEDWHPIGEHNGASVWHTVVQDPQWSADRRDVSQPSSALPLQSPYPSAQAAGVRIQLPAKHVMPAGEPMLATAVQSWPHEPQFFTSLDVSPHPPVPMSPPSALASGPEFNSPGLGDPSIEASWPGSSGNGLASSKPSMLEHPPMRGATSKRVQKVRITWRCNGMRFSKGPARTRAPLAGQLRRRIRLRYHGRTRAAQVATKNR